MTINFLMKWFYRQTHSEVLAVGAERARLNIMARDLERACKEKDEVNKMIGRAIVANTATMTKRGEIAREYIRKETESGLRRGVTDADRPETK